MNHPFLDPALEVRWTRLTPDRVVPDIREALRRAEDRLAAIRSQDPATVTFASTILALDEATVELNRAWGWVSHLDAVNNGPELRAARNTLLPEVTDFFTKLPLDEGLWRVIKAFAETAGARDLEGVEARLLEETLKDFRTSGADLDAQGKARIQALESEMATVAQKFSENELDGTNAYELIIDDAARLRGLPASFVEAARESAEQNGHPAANGKAFFRFTLQAPSIFPALKYVDDAELRKELWEASSRVGRFDPHNNTGAIRSLLRLRDEKARLLGYRHFPDFVLERRMARSGEAALAFVEDLHAKTKAAFDAENAELEAFRTKHTGESGPLAPWEQAYWAEKLRRERFDFDEEALRPYFAVDTVLDGMFTITGRIFGLRVAQRAAGNRPEVWHDDVQFYDVFDAASDTHLGSFYTDWFPRKSKRSGAWMHDLAEGNRHPTHASTPHLGLMAGNMTPPSGGRPALLSHSDVETIFHEFGHLLHHILGEVPYRSLNGTSVAWDFVELPSQLLENWCWDRAALDLFARHYETGEPIPEELFQKMIAARRFHAARAQMRQLSFAKMDLALHLEPERAATADLDALCRELLDGYLVPSSVPVPPILYRFGHLFGDPLGYAAGYYSYKWAEVLDADAFSRFQDEGILNPDTGGDFRRHILSAGNSEEPAVLYRRFMGRDPDPDALLRRLGLIGA